MENKKVSVIMSTYKTPDEFLEKAINSILNQTYKNIFISPFIDIFIVGFVSYFDIILP